MTARARRAPSPARRIALEALVKAPEPRAPGLADLIAESVRREQASAPDAALARELAYAVSRHRLWLEHVLARFVERPVESFAPRVHLALLIGLAQVVELDRIPDHAIVDETVRLVAAQPGGAKLTGLANAVMRRIVRENPETHCPDENTPWRLRYSVPDRAAEPVLDLLGEDETVQFFRSSNEPAPLCLRPRRGADELRRRLESERPDSTIEAGSLLPDSLKLAGKGLAPGELDSFRDGECTVEDEGAQAACVLALSGLRPRRVLDLCAAPGGKTAHLADRIGPEAIITATDVSPPKLRRLKETLERLGLAERVPVRLARELDPTVDLFDLILVDAPCSGFGTLRRHPEIRYRRGPEDIEKLARVQFGLLERAAEHLDPGGLLAYSVCTATHAEGESLIDQFLVLHPDFEPDTNLGTDLPFDAKAFETGQPGVWRIWTHRWGCDTFTVARLRKTALA